jgi:hypothetical protein
MTLRERAEARFKRKETQLLEGQQAWAEYEAQGRAVREKTARLRALRLAQGAALQPREPRPQSAAETIAVSAHIRRPARARPGKAHK